MSSSIETWKGQGACVEDIEQQMNELLSVRKEKIEESLKARIDQEKEVAQKKIQEMEQQYSEEKKLLEEYKFNLADLQTSKAKVVEQIREHFNRTMKCQEQIKITLEEANDELEKINALSGELEIIRKRVEEENEKLNQALAERFGIETQLPKGFEFEDVPEEWNQEVTRMERLRELLTSLEGSEVVKQAAFSAGDNGGSSDAAASPETEVPEADTLPAPEAEEENIPTTMPEELPEEMTEDAAQKLAEEMTDEYLVDESGSKESAQEDEPRAEAEPEAEQEEETVDMAAEELGEESVAVEEPTAEGEPALSEAPSNAPEEEAPASSSGDDASHVPASLACFRKTEQIANGNEFGYFENGSTRILDGESFIRAMARISEEARELHSQLDGKESIKDVFMLKQEILNEQEILRKLFFRALTFCEKEDGALPYYISDVLNIETLKDVLELLTIGNWSDPVEFNVFQNNMKSLKKSYDEKFEAVQDYEASLREQIENGS